MNLRTLKSGMLLLLCFTTTRFHAAAQDKLPEITAKDFEPKLYSIDSSAQAVILYTGGTAKYEANSDSWFNVIYTYHKRIRLLNKNAFDYATIQIPLYRGEHAEDLFEKLDAVTYTMENGMIVKTKVDKESVFKDKASSTKTIEKFTFPNLKEGCIIDYTYRISSPIATYMRGWLFQDRFPVLKSEYDINLPALFDFVFLNTGYYDLEPQTKRSSELFRIFSSGQIINYNADITESKWSLTNLPAMVKEKYSSTLRNYAAQVEFQLRSLNFPNAAPKPIMGTWAQLIGELMKDENFGAGIAEKNGWLDDDLAALKEKDDSLAYAKNIFRYVQQNITCSDYDAVYTENSLKSVYKAKKGNVAEINLLLVAMLRRAGFKADPVMLSTKDNGFAYEAYPLINRFNYVIARTTIGGKEILLDASRKKMGFNHLPEYCYNGSGRIVSDAPNLIPLLSDSLKDIRNTAIFISNSEDGKKMEGSFNSDLGYYESVDLRDELAGTDSKAYFKKMNSSFSNNIEMKNPGIDSLDQYDERASVHYDFSFGFGEDIIYFAPMMAEAYKDNPFTSAVRNYPVEMPYATDETIVLNMDIPKGYKIDELPRSERINLNENEGMFEYIIQSDAQMIQLRCKLKINKATFTPDDYNTLRDFFSRVVKIQNEQIVFKKIKS